MTTIGGITIDFQASVGSFIADVAKVQKTAEDTATGVTRSLNTIGKGFTSAGAGVAEFTKGFFSLQGAVAGLAGGLGAASFIEGITRSLNAAGDIGDVAARVSVGTKALQELRFAATQTGVASDGLDDALQELSIRLGEFRSGDAGAKQAFDQLGIAIDITSGKLASTDQVFTAVATSLSRFEDKALATSAAAKIFGEDVGPRLMPLLNQGGSGIDALRQKASDLGLVVGDDVVKAADQARDKLGILSDVIATRAVVAFANLAPQVDAVATALIDALPEVTRFVDEAIGKFQELDAFVKDTLGGIPDSIGPTFKIEGGILGAIFGDTDAEPTVGAIAEVKAEIDLLNATIADSPTYDPVLEDRLKAAKGRLAELQAELGKTADAAAATADAIEFADKRSALGLRAAPPAASVTDGFVPPVPASKSAEPASRRSGGSSRTAAPGLTDDQRRAAQLFDQTRTSVEKYNAALAELDQLYAKGAISQEVFSRATEQTKAELDQALQLEGAATIKDEWAALKDFFDANPVAPVVDTTKVDAAALEMQRAHDAIYTFQGGATAAFQDYADQAQRYGEMAGDAIAYGVDTASDAITEFVTTGKTNVKGLVDSIIADLTRLAIRQAIIGALGAAFGGGATATTDRGFSAGDRIDARAGGGPVGRGRAYLVGEKGPELFVPGGSGMIVPNGARAGAQASLGGGGGGGQIVNVIDKRGTGAPAIEQRQRKGAGGKTEVDLIVADSHSRNLAAGRHSAQMSEGFGVRPRPVR